jgi:hypothetical protein
MNNMFYFTYRLRKKRKVKKPRKKNEDFLINKERARVFVKEKIVKLNTRYNFTYNHISIKNQKTRWGSCSKKGNLNFNYKIVTLPEHLAEYIIVHELCHLGEFNHSQKFWDLVARTVPDYKKKRNELRKISGMISQ